MNRDQASLYIAVAHEDTIFDLRVAAYVAAMHRLAALTGEPNS